MVQITRGPQPCSKACAGSQVIADAFVSQFAAFSLGDVDLSGVIDFGDIPPFIAVLQSGVYQKEADVNEDDLVDFLDISSFIDLLIQQ